MNSFNINEQMLKQGGMNWNNQILSLIFSIFKSRFCQNLVVEKKHVEEKKGGVWTKWASDTDLIFSIFKSRFGQNLVAAKNMLKRKRWSLGEEGVGYLLRSEEGIGIGQASHPAFHPFQN